MMAGRVLCSRALVAAAGRWPGGARPARRMLGSAPLLRRPLARLPATGRRSAVCAARPYSTQPESKEDLHTIIKNAERGSGPSETREFQAETRMLLDIVACSLYSEKEVFVRELVSNASDALEKLRYLRLTEAEAMSSGSAEAPLEIHIGTDKLANTFTIQDTGVGMTRKEVVESLGTIARSGSKEFLQKLAANDGAAGSIIGQFGVGFYSAFMVADRVEVFTQSRRTGAKAVRWSSDGSGQYELSEAEGVQEGTKIVLTLKPDCADFADAKFVRKVIEKYSNFVGSPIYLNGQRANTLQALWLLEPRDVTQAQHDEFYRYLSGAFDVPRFTVHFCTDVPLSIRCLLYVPEGKPGLFDMGRDGSGVSLYSRKVLIKPRAEILPKWLRFVKGVVESEDIPLNLSRELLQDSALIRKIRTVIVSRLIRHLARSAEREPESYGRFYQDYGVFLKEGILAAHEQAEKEEIAQLLRFQSSQQPVGNTVTLTEYCSRMKEGQRDIYYLAAPSRQLAEASPYFEAVRSRDVEVLFCLEPYDELVLAQLRQFGRKSITSVEKEMRRDAEEAHEEPEEVRGLAEWLKAELGPMVHKVKVTRRLQKHPCLVSVEEMAAARHFVKTSLQSFSEEERYRLLEPTLEINPDHPIIAKLSGLRSSEPELAKKLALQIFGNAMVTAGLVDDPRKVTSELNDLLTALLERL
ncbi:TNF receptor associated protein 1 [Amblyomma americanum]